MIIKKVPGQRGGAIPEEVAPPPPLVLRAEDLKKARELVAGIGVELGVVRGTEGATAQGEPVVIVIDPRAVLVAVLHVRGLRSSPRVAKEAGITADQLEGVHRRARALGTFLSGLEQLRGSAAGARLRVAAELGARWAALSGDLQRDVAQAGRSAAERARLKDAGGDVLAQAEREQAQQKLRRDELKGAREAAAAKVKEAAERRRLLYAMLALKDDEDIDAARLDELLSIYDAQVRVPGEEQRQAAR